MTRQQADPRPRIKPYRRLFQTAVLGMIIFIPLSSQNPNSWAPSRLVLGQMPEPAVFHLAGDTWTLSINSFELSHPLAFMDAWFSSNAIYLPLLLAVLIPLALTVILGRIFCSWLCPVGFLLELNMKVRQVLRKFGIGRELDFSDLRYPVLTVCLLLTFFLAIPVLSLVDPPHTLGRELMSFFTHQAVSPAGAGLLLGLVVLDTFISSRACCSKLCPSGGGLSLLGKYRLLRINLREKQCIACGKCDEACPYQLFPMRLSRNREINWTKCDNCGLCRDICPTGAITYQFKAYRLHNKKR